MLSAWKANLRTTENELNVVMRSKRVCRHCLRRQSFRTLLTASTFLFLFFFFSVETPFFNGGHTSDKGNIKEGTHTTVPYLRLKLFMPFRTIKSASRKVHTRRTHILFRNGTILKENCGS